jgi:Zn-dependent protease with chaperone function
MKMKCPHCNQPLESQEDLTGQTVQCPSCNRDFTVPRPPSIPVSRGQNPVNLTALRDPKEGTAFGWLVFFSIILWILLALWIVSSFGLVLIIIGLIALVRYMIELFAVAYIKTNAVEVSDRQFPEIYRIAQEFSERIGQPLPTLYVMQENVWNALAMKIAGKRLVVLLSGAVDSILLKGSVTQLGWLVGHELGHHYAGHLNFWRRTTAQLGSWFVWVGLWYKRRCELTCDRYGLACSANLSESLRAVCNMAVGAQLASDVDIDQAIAQWNRHRSEFFVKYRTLYSTHPHTLWRLEELKKSARELSIQ